MAAPLIPDLIDQVLRGTNGQASWANPQGKKQTLTQHQGKERKRMTPIKIQAHLGHYTSPVESSLAEIAENNILGRIWAQDHTVWKPEPTEISNRLGWLNIAQTMKQNIARIQQLVSAVQAAGYTNVLLLGMGGSSLAPEVFRKVFGVLPDYLDLAILDSTVPGAVLDLAQKLDPVHTLLVVSTKSGGTVETISGFKFFYNWMSEAVGQDKAGEHFIAITDPGSSLVSLAERYHFRETFLNDPNIGGRYSVLSYFGMVPAALVGIDLDKLMERASSMAAECREEASVQHNPGAWLGTITGQLAQMGRDKLTFFLSPQIASFGDWVEQLVAESTGKDGKGILPVVGEAINGAEVYGSDRLFVCLRLADDNTFDAQLAGLQNAGHPVVIVDLNDIYDLGGQFFLWEIATAVASYRLGINPFDQPNVEAAKVLAREIVADYSRTGKLAVEPPSLVDGDIEVYLPDSIKSQSAADALRALLTQAQANAYIAIQAYIHPTPEVDSALSDLRTRWRDVTHLATTLGYGPRFLHSTGQLHKGDAGRGLFIQITADDPQDVPIPDEAGKPDSSMSFGVLKTAQALGDARALKNAGRLVLRLHFKGNVAKSIAALR
jgi:glucose-6-phosphate isomerase